jgi:hypothetical protein
VQNFLKEVRASAAPAAPSPVHLDRKREISGEGAS